MTVAVVGASDNVERYSYKAVALLLENGHDVYPVNLTVPEILGRKVYRSLSEITVHVDTVSLYVNKTVSSSMADELAALKPRRVLFNPGAENPDLMMHMRGEGILAQEACTLVLLKTGQF